jgi:heptosyltransferase-3
VLEALRAAAPTSRLEVMAYPGIATLAARAGTVDQARSIEYGPLAGFFTRGAILEPGLREYFGSFDLVLNYLYDPDDIFTGNLRAAGAKRILAGPHRPGENGHAIDQLAAPLAELGIPLARRAARLGVVPERVDRPVVALHPGSGSPAKNWPSQHWAALVADLLQGESDLCVAIVGGEADAESLLPLRGFSRHERVLWWENLPLTGLAERLAGTRAYIGHDTGVSHLAAVVGTPSLLLFGPTDPGIWAPPHEHVRILRAPGDRLENLSPSAVRGALWPMVAAPRLATGAPPPEDGRP